MQDQRTVSFATERRRPLGRHAAYTLVELVGVLAVVSVLAGIASTVVFRSVDLAILEAEEGSLQELGAGLVEYVRETRSAPGPDSWCTALATMVATPLVEIEKNEKGNARRLLVDPNFWGLGQDAMPFAQSTTGVAEPLSPRFIILSSVGEALPSDAIDFQEVWDCEEGGIISTNAPWNAWDGNWDHLRACRINLSAYFHHVTLHNIGSDTSAGFLIDGVGDGDSAPLEVPGGLLDTYLIDGSSLELTVDGETVAIEVIRDDRSLYFNRGQWRNYLVEGIGGDDALTSFLTSELRDWVSLYGYGMSDLWFDFRQDRFQLILNQSECPDLVTMDVENGSDSGFNFSMIHGGGTGGEMYGVTWYMGDGAAANDLEVGVLLGTYDEADQELTILDIDSNVVGLDFGSLYSGEQSDSVVSMSSDGLDFGVTTGSLIGTIEYAVDLDPSDGVVDEEGSFYVYNYGFGPPNGIVSVDSGARYEVSIWANNYDNVNGTPPAVEDIRGLDLRLVFDAPAADSIL